MARRKTNEEFIKEIYNLVSNQYIFLEEYKNSTKKIKCKHNVKSCLHEYMVVPNSFIRGSRCPKCFEKNKPSQKEFEERVNKEGLGEYAVEGKYINAREKVKIKHLNCGYSYDVTPTSFFDKKNRCVVCSGYKKKSTQEYKDSVYELCKDEYSVKSEYINALTKISMIHNICKHIYKVTPNNFINGRRCPKCKGSRISKSVNKDTEWFIEKTYGLFGEEYSVLEPYTNARTKIYMRHNVCNSKFKTMPSSFLGGVSCPKCFGNFRKTQKEFAHEVYSMVGETYAVLGNYVNAKTKIRMRHNVCGSEYMVLPPDFTGAKVRCPICRSSKGEVEISRVLENMGVRFIPQYKFKDCLNLRPLPFDFYLNDYDILIEFDGRQHFEPVDFFGGEESFKKTLERDEIKNRYCKDKNIDLIRIPYWDFEKIESLIFKAVLNKMLYKAI